MTPASLATATGRRVGLAAAGLLLLACTVPAEAPPKTGPPDPGASTADLDPGVDTAAASERYQALPAPQPGLVAVVGGTRALVRGVPRTPSSPAGPARVRVSTATDDRAYAALCAGRADVVETVRPMSEGERAACDVVGLRPEVLPVAFEASTVVVARGSGRVGCLSPRQLTGLLSDPPTLTSWAQLGPGEGPVRVRGADTSVGERLAWLLGSTEERRGRAVVLPYADYASRRDRLTVFEVGQASGRSGCVAPDDTSIAAGDYPLTRPVLLTTTQRSRARPEVLSFLQSVLGELPTLAGSAGFVPAAEQQRQRLLRRLDDDRRSSTPPPPPPAP